MPILLSVLLLAAPAAPPARFDLDCTGGRAWATGGEIGTLAAHYRIDTVAGRWCRDTCDATAPLVSTAGGKLVFKQREAPSGDRFSETLDLTTGAWLDLFQGEYPPGDYWRTEGRCTVVGFTALPAG